MYTCYCNVRLSCMHANVFLLRLAKLINETDARGAETVHNLRLWYSEQDTRQLLEAEVMVKVACR